MTHPYFKISVSQPTGSKKSNNTNVLYVLLYQIGNVCPACVVHIIPGLNDKVRPSKDKILAGISSFNLFSNHDVTMTVCLVKRLLSF